MHYVKFPTIALYIRTRRRFDTKESFWLNMDLVKKVFSSKRNSYLSAFRRAYGDSPQTDGLDTHNHWIKYAKMMGVL